jgi:dihydroorotate dehydrogenase
LLNALAEARAQLVAQHGRQVPIFIKIAPDLDDKQIQVIASILKRYGCDASGKATGEWGLIATNTTLARDAVKTLPHGDEAGGLSGAPVFEASNRVVSAMRDALGVGFPIVGVGGVMSGADAVAKMNAGADMVQIYTGLIYRGPGLVLEAARAIARQANKG